MAEGVWKGVYPQVFGCSKQLSPNKFFDLSTPSMRKGRDRGKKREKEKTDEKSGHYVIASSRPPERHALMPIPDEQFLTTSTQHKSRATATQ